MKKYLRIYIAVAFLLGAVGILRSQGVRYIRIAQNSSGASDFLHLAEIRAIQSGLGNNVALGKAVTTDSEGTSLAKINYVDGNTSTSGGSAVAGKAGFVEIDLGATFVLSQVEIVNRFSSSSNVAIRARNLQLTLKNGNGEVVWSSAIDAYQGQNAALTTYWRQFESPPAFQITQACPTPSSARLSLSNSAAGNALRFTGVPGQSVSVPSTLPIGDKDFTVEMWVKVPVVGQGGLTASEPVGRLMSTRTSGENTNWAINASGRLSMEWGLATTTGTTDLRDGKWHHLLFSRDKTANTYKGFLDGNLELSASSAGSDVTFEAGGLRIGTAVSTGRDVFHGLIDELRVWKVRKEDIPNHNPNREIQPTSQLELYYRFNENNSLSASSSAGGAINVSGTSSSDQGYVSVPDANSLDFTNAFTLEAWINPSQYATNTGNYGNGVVSKCRRSGGNGYAIGITPAGKLFGVVNNTASNVPVESSDTVPLNTWSHIAGVFDGTSMTIYLNGVQVGQTTFPAMTLLNSTEPLAIGIMGPTLGNWLFNGQIDEVRVWNSVRTQAQIAANMKKVIAPQSGLVGYYSFNESTGSIADDLSGAGNMGAFTGAKITRIAASDVPMESTTSIVYDYSLNGRHGVLSDSLLTIDSRVSDAPAPISWASALWSTGSTDTSIVASQSGKYWATASSGSGMVAVDTFTLQLPAIKQELSCGSAVLLAVGGETYAWAGGGTQPDTTVTANGTYTVSITSASCGTVVVSTQVTLPESSRYFRDSDGDSYGNPLIFQDACTKPAGFVSNAVDCDDGVATVYPGAPERCDGLDNDCDGSIDEGLVIPTYYRDADGDGLGDPAFVVKSCMRPSGYVTTGTDCDDTNASIGTSSTLSTFYRDADGDGYGAASIKSCAQPIGYVTASGDCDDTNPRIHPGAPENCDNIDDNCNGILTEGACPGLTTDVSGNCTTISSVNVLQGESFFNYGSASNAINTSLRGNFTIGQPLVGTYNGQTATGAFGFWGRFLLAPSAPAIRATEGDLPDRIQVTWKPDPLSPVASGFKLYRNGALLASVDGDSRSFIDFNVIAGQFYTYEVAGVNSFGEGYKGKTLGFLNPNGVVTGRITTFSGNSVPGTIVTLSPTIGKSLSFNQLASSFVENSSAFPNKGNFTVSCWVKIGNNNNSAAIFDLGSHLGKNWWLHTQRSGEAKGIAFGLGRTQGDTTVVRYTFPAATANAWHNVVATYNGASLLLYVDGELVETVVATYQSFQSVLFLGQKPTGGGNFNGQLDELRFFNRQLAQTEIQRYMNQSISSTTPGLTAYWKFDEGVGSRAYDLTANKLVAYHCGTQWSDDKPDVVNAAVSDKNGAYEIEGVNYGAGATFTASPSKDFHFNQSLEFNAANNQYANLTPFALSDSTTITVTIKPFDFQRKQTILSKASATGTNQFSIFIENGILKISSGSTAQSFSTLDMGFHYLAFVLRKDGSNLRVQLYKNGEIAGTQTIPAPSSWTGLPWKLGAAANGATGHKEYFTGLIDEVAFFKGLLPLNKIQEYANIGTSVTDQTLTSYFNLNEGSDTTIHDMGTALTGKGTLKGASWSTVAAIIRTEPHEFTPAARLVTLNPSNTSVDQVDFIDQSTIVVSGYVRFENTDCFQAKVEILVNGRSYVPQIFTDAEGKFTADFEPGAKVVLTPKFENHTFYPAFWEIPSLSTPVSGILFRNQVKRKVVGQVAGGLCRKSVIPDGAIAKVKVATLNGCYEQVIQLPADGKFIFNGVPPDSVTVSVIEHSNPVIYTFYQNKGGEVLDLKMEDDTVDFIYLAPPNVELTPIETNECGVPMLNMLQKTKTTIKVFEEYTGGKCYLDTALITINNDIAHLDQFDTLMTAGSLVHSYRVEEPNIVAPYLKYLQVTAEAHDEQATASLSAVVLGRRPRQTTFTSTSPGIPILILRDPPGDASYSFVESGETTCQTWGISASDTKDGETYVVASLGPDIETEMGTPFFATSLQVDVTADLGLSLSGSTTSYSSSEMETCITATKTISTSESDFVVGSEMGGDVYVGGAINFLYGITDELIYDTANCSFLLDKGLFVFPQGFATTFVYSEYHIINNVIPALTLIGDTASIKSWQDILSLNRRLKKEAVFAKNLSFDAGAVYEESETTEVSKTITTEWTQGFSAGFSAEFGTTVNGLGLVAGLSMNFSREETKTASNTTASSRTVGYVLSDDDPGDNITVNVKKDRGYGTPVFETVSGQSQCPHEPNTQPRQGVDLAAETQVAVNVPMNDVAVFKLFLGNTSQSEEVKFYTLEGLQENNPLGAVIRFNGQPTLNVGVPFGQNVEVTMTVARGPVAFTYENLRVGFFSDCEVERADALGIDPPAGFNEELEFDVYFLEPCSPIDIGFPLQDWVMTPASGNLLNITVNGYDTKDPDLELVRVQFRRSQGDGSWINIAELPKAQLGDVFTIQPWNISSLKDGFYEIRAVSQCFSGALNPGISKVVKGKIERTPPEIFGTPEPADGVLSANDEISITFTEPIRCDQIIQADFFENNNIGLYNAQTGKLVDAVITCNGDKITIVPNVPNQFIENTVMRVEVNNIRDLAGNTFLEKKWEFFVDRNPIRWVGGDVDMMKKESEVVTLTRRLENTGGQALEYEIKEVPSWVRVFPQKATLSPGVVQTITFEFDSTMALGIYKDTIYATGALGDEPLIIDARVACPPPAWAVRPSAYTYTMNLSLQLDIEGNLSRDREDCVAAFINGECRGIAKVKYQSALDKWMAFLTVYSNNFSGEEVTLQIWDASACLLYGNVIERFPFEAEGLVGSPLVPQVVRTNNLVLREIVLEEGWNWISFNLAFPDSSTNAALKSLSHPQNDFIKGQRGFAEYLPSASQWVGSLPLLSNKTMYQYRADVLDTITMLGRPINLATTTIPIQVGWNWISYLPQAALPVNTALSSLTPLNGDVIKGQTGFAQYVAGKGWIGNLEYLQTPAGYLLKSSTAGTLQYPNPSVGNLQEQLGTEKANRKGGLVAVRGLGAHWQVDAAKFEHSMTLVGIMQMDGKNVTEKGYELGAFAKGELRGSGQALYIEALGAHLFFVTVYANRAGELLNFKLYNGREELSLKETLFFSTDAQTGSVAAPHPFQMPVATPVEEALQATGRFDIMPNPFAGETLLRFDAERAGQARVTVLDVLGGVKGYWDVSVGAGTNDYRWDGNAGAGRLPAGVYLIRLEVDGRALTRKVIVQ